MQTDKQIHSATGPRIAGEGSRALLMAVFNHLPDATSVNSALLHVDYVVFIDNSTDKSISSSLDRFVSAHPGKCIVIRPGGNLGLSRGYNLAVDHVGRLGVTWLHFTDHDAVFQEEYFTRSREAWGTLSRTYGRVGAVVPIVSDDETLLGHGIGLRGPWFTLTSAITSGILTTVEILREVGGFDEKLFVEGADFELTTRMRTHGWKIYCLNQILIVQDFETPVVGEGLTIKVGQIANSFRSLVRVAIGNANIFRTKLSVYSPRRWAELTANLRKLQGTKGLRRHAKIVSLLNRLEYHYVRIYCVRKA
jgi:hypothetical protein